MRQKQKHVVQVQGQVRWEFYQDAKSGRWIAVCQPLALVLEADSHTELRENIEDSLRLFLRSVFADGQFASFLKERGWVAVGFRVTLRRKIFDLMFLSN